MKFTDQQLASLKQGFANIDSVNPDRLPEFYSMFDAMDDETLFQVAKADIKFLSKLGANEARRRGIDVY